jgi:hypothetical protein
MANPRPSTTRSNRPGRFATALLSVMVASLFSGLPIVSAQDIIMPDQGEPVVAPSLRQGIPPLPPSAPPVPPQNPFSYGGITLRPRISYRHTMANGLPVLGGRRVSSEIRTVAPGLSIDLGQSWTMDYSPTWVSYTARAMSDSFDQSARLTGATSFQDWAFQFAQSYSDTNPTLIETAQQTAQEIWTTNLGASYRYSEKVQFQASAGMTERYTTISPNIRVWSGRGTISLKATSLLSLNLNPDFSYTEIDDAADIYGEKLTAQLVWRPLDKLTVSGGGGMEFTHSRSASGKDLTNPVFDLSLNYQPFETTSITMASSRSVANSYFSDQVTETFLWRAGIQQRLLGRYYLSANYSRSEGDYTATNNLVVTSRVDKVESLGARLTTKLFGRLSLSALYQRSKNTSSVSLFSFTSRQYGVELQYSF